MRELEPRQKIKALEWIRERINFMPGCDYICGELYNWLHIQEYPVSAVIGVEEIFNLFPELLEEKPEGVKIGEPWYGTKGTGNEKRIEDIDRTIERIKEKENE